MRYFRNDSDFLGEPNQAWARAASARTVPSRASHCPLVIRILREPSLATTGTHTERDARSQRVLPHSVVRSVVALRRATVHHGLRVAALHVCTEGFVVDALL